MSNRIGEEGEESEGRLNPEDLPVLTHTEVLGVDIAVPQESHYKLMQGEEIRSGRLDVRIEAWQGEIGKKSVERDLSHWARRNLFDGVGTQ